MFLSFRRFRPFLSHSCPMMSSSDKKRSHLSCHVPALLSLLHQSQSLSSYRLVRTHPNPFLPHARSTRVNMHSISYVLTYSETTHLKYKYGYTDTDIRTYINISTDIRIRITEELTADAATYKRYRLINGVPTISRFSPTE